MKSEEELLKEHGLRSPPKKLTAYKESKLEVGQHYPIITNVKRLGRRKITYVLRTKERVFGRWRVVTNTPA